MSLCLQRQKICFWKWVAKQRCVYLQAMHHVISLHDYPLSRFLSDACQCDQGRSMKHFPGHSEPQSSPFGLWENVSGRETRWQQVAVHVWLGHLQEWHSEKGPRVLLYFPDLSSAVQYPAMCLARSKHEARVFISKWVNGWILWVYLGYDM